MVKGWEVSFSLGTLHHAGVFRQEHTRSVMLHCGETELQFQLYFFTMTATCFNTIQSN